MAVRSLNSCAWASVTLSWPFVAAGAASVSRSVYRKARAMAEAMVEHSHSFRLFFLFPCRLSPVRGIGQPGLASPVEGRVCAAACSVARSQRPDTSFRCTHSRVRPPWPPACCTAAPETGKHHAQWLSDCVTGCSCRRLPWDGIVIPHSILRMHGALHERPIS